MSKYIVLDIVFHASSLNYDQGSGNYQELKKITKWDGKQYVLVSRYALRYSILEWASKICGWKLASKDGLGLDKSVVQIGEKLVKNGKFLEYPEFDLFGFMSTAKKKSKGEGENSGEGESEASEKNGVTITRTSPVKISHAVSLTPYNFDSHFSANLGVMKRAGGTGSNPINIEEKKDFYIYNVTIDLDRVGKIDEGYSKIDDKEEGEKIGNKEEEKGKKKRITQIDDKEKEEMITQLIESIFTLKREIKGRMEDLSPWLVVAGLYDKEKYDSYTDRIELSKTHSYKIITKRKETTDKEGRKIEEIENETIEKQSPKFVIDIGDFEEMTQESLLEKIKKFIENGENGASKPIVFKTKFVEVSNQK